MDLNNIVSRIDTVKPIRTKDEAHFASDNLQPEENTFSHKGSDMQQ